VRSKLGLAMSGGGLRGFAQIGVLDELEKAGIPIDFIAGSSMGSVVGGMYAIGYSPAEIEEFALTTDWAHIFSNAPERSTMFLGQKSESNRHIISIRFDGLKPYFPQAISQGQQLFNAFHSLVMRANTLPNANFDDLKIPLRIVALDKYDGTQKVFKEGNLALAILSSIAAPFLFSDVTIDGRAYVDGGIINNIPTDVAESMGSDIIVAIDCTSPLLTSEQMVFPWKQMDHYSSIMQKERSERSLRLANIVIKPELDNLDGYEVNAINQFIELGRQKARQMIPEILNVLKNVEESDGLVERFTAQTVSFIGNQHLAAAYLKESVETSSNSSTTKRIIENDLKNLFETGYFENVKAVIKSDGEAYSVEFHVIENPLISTVTVSGSTVFPEEDLRSLYAYGESNIFNTNEGAALISSILDLYNERGYSISQVTEFQIDTIAQSLHIVMDEGIITSIQLLGNEKTQPHVIKREMPQKSGDIFDFFLVQEGINNIYGSGLLQRVYPTIRKSGDDIILQINIEEQKTDIIRLGTRYDQDQQAKGFVEFSDDNFAGLGMKSRLHLRYGPRDQIYRYAFRLDRIFVSYLTIGGDLHYTSRTGFLTDDKKDFIRRGDFDDTRIGGSLSFGRQLARFGTVSARFNIDDISVEALPFLELDNEVRDVFFDRVNENIQLRTITLESIVDTRDKIPFPQQGNFHRIYYENASSLVGSEISYVKFYASLGYVYTFKNKHTIESRATAGFADETLPYSKRFRLGGMSTFLGERLNVLHGKNLIATNIGYRFKLPLQNIFDTYFTLRWDLVSLIEKSEKIQFNDFHNSFGTFLSFDLPIGPLEIGYGKTIDLGDRFHFSLGHSF
jgi:NTE family protein